MKKHKGFTLIEVLIVIVIIATLAALILPRYFARIEDACLAEAHQMLGALLRAYKVAYDTTGTNLPALTDAFDSTQMARLGLQAFRSGTSKFVYSCTAGGTSCTATRIIG